MTRHLSCRFPAIAAALLAASAWAAGASLPPPGEYRIDGEATSRSGSGPTATERTESWNGATGERTITSHAGPAINPGSRQTYAGSGPVTWCVQGGAAAPVLPDRCSTRWWPADGAASLQADCRAGRLHENWQQLDERTWERRMSFTTAAQPLPQATADAMAPVYAQIEQTIRTGAPAEADAARQQLAALKAAQAGGDAGAVTTLKERWTRIANSCSSRAGG